MGGWQHYTDPVATDRMAQNLCPECGKSEDEHGGWGGARCSLTDMGVAGRIFQWKQDQLPEGHPTVHDIHEHLTRDHRISVSGWDMKAAFDFHRDQVHTWGRGGEHIEGPSGQEIEDERIRAAQPPNPLLEAMRERTFPD